MYTHLFLPPIVQIGAGVSLNAASVMQSLSLCRPFIVTDKYISKVGMLNDLLATFDAAGFNYKVFDEISAEPTTSDIALANTLFATSEFDCVVGFGGGSSLDVAKLIGGLAGQVKPVGAYKVPHNNEIAGLPVIAIPTTAGTGSEATSSVVISDAVSHEKMLLKGRAFVPVVALVDYTLTLTMPFRLTADTGIDSLTHAIEAYVSAKANSYSSALALSAMSKIYPNIRIVCHEPDNEEAREAMMCGAFEAGVAFSNASVALVHGMSRPLGALFGIPHGLSNAMLLPLLTKRSIPYAKERYFDCAKALGLLSHGSENDDSCNQLVQGLFRLSEDLQVPSPSQYGVDRADYERAIPIMVQQALASGSPQQNPWLPTAQEMTSLYLELFQKR